MLSTSLSSLSSITYSSTPARNPAARTSDGPPLSPLLARPDPVLDVLPFPQESILSSPTAGRFQLEPSPVKRDKRPDGGVLRGIVEAGQAGWRKGGNGGEESGSPQAEGSGSGGQAAGMIAHSKRSSQPASLQPAPIPSPASRPVAFSFDDYLDLPDLDESSQQTTSTQLTATEHDGDLSVPSPPLIARLCATPPPLAPSPPASHSSTNPNFRRSRIRSSPGPCINPALIQPSPPPLAPPPLIPVRDFWALDPYTGIYERFRQVGGVLYKLLYEADGGKMRGRPMHTASMAASSGGRGSQRISGRSPLYGSAASWDLIQSREQAKARARDLQGRPTQIYNHDWLYGGSTAQYYPTTGPSYYQPLTPLSNSGLLDAAATEPRAKLSVRFANPAFATKSAAPGGSTRQTDLDQIAGKQIRGHQVQMAQGDAQLAFAYAQHQSDLSGALYASGQSAQQYPPRQYQNQQPLQHHYQHQYSAQNQQHTPRQRHPQYQGIDPRMSSTSPARPVDDGLRKAPHTAHQVQPPSLRRKSGSRDRPTAHSVVSKTTDVTIIANADRISTHNALGKRSDFDPPHATSHGADSDPSRAAYSIRSSSQAVSQGQGARSKESSPQNSARNIPHGMSSQKKTHASAHPGQSTTVLSTSQQHKLPDMAFVSTKPHATPPKPPKAPAVDVTAVRPAHHKHVTKTYSRKRERASDQPVEQTVQHPSAIAAAPAIPDDDAPIAKRVKTHRAAAKINYYEDPTSTGANTPDSMHATSTSTSAASQKHGASKGLARAATLQSKRPNVPNLAIKPKLRPAVAATQTHGSSPPQGTPHILTADEMRAWDELLMANKQAALPSDLPYAFGNTPGDQSLTALPMSALSRSSTSSSKKKDKDRTERNKLRTISISVAQPIPASPPNLHRTTRHGEQQARGDGVPARKTRAAQT